ncbi:MAG: hypothetical protein IKU98_06590 [Bacteroidaceae bacterium]|nr:hypothetical protein [Bacteroidaceae bacterium]
MEDLIVELVTSVVVAVLAFVVGIFRERQYDIKMEDVYVKNKLFFDVSGMVVKALDEKLYNEMEEAITKMKVAYESPTFTTASFNAIVKECKDVFDRAQVLIKSRG